MQLAFSSAASSQTAGCGVVDVSSWEESQWLAKCSAW